MAEVEPFEVEDVGGGETRKEGDLPKHRVALVVFATVGAVDAHDAEYVLERMLRDKIGFDADKRLKMEYTMKLGMGSDPVFNAEVVYMMGAGTALRNGYLGAYPSGKAWRTFGHDDPGPVELS